MTQDVGTSRSQRPTSLAPVELPARASRGRRPGGRTLASATPPVALAHDYLTQRGGAERVAQLMAQAFPSAPMHTTLYDPHGTFPEFAALDVQPGRLNRVGVLRRHHRLALPFLAPTVSTTHIDADVLLVSSSGWAHGIRTTGRKVIYCHAPARWLYQRDRYLGPAGGAGSVGVFGAAGDRLRRGVAASALSALSSPLQRWDLAAAHSASRYLVNSTVVRDAVRSAYGIEAEILPPPPALLPAGEEQPVSGVEPGFFLCVARLLPYKNVDVVVEAALRVPGATLVVVGDGPERPRLTALAGKSARVRLLGRVSDDQLRWLYRNTLALVAASYEDYGLSPLEAASFGHPAVALRAGGFLDTVIEGRTGVFFDQPEAQAVAHGLEQMKERQWDAEAIRAHAQAFSRARFTRRLQEIVDLELVAGRAA